MYLTKILFVLIAAALVSRTTSAKTEVSCTATATEVLHGITMPPQKELWDVDGPGWVKDGSVYTHTHIVGRCPLDETHINDVVITINLQTGEFDRKSTMKCLTLTGQQIGTHWTGSCEI